MRQIARFNLSIIIAFIALSTVINIADGRGGRGRGGGSFGGIFGGWRKYKKPTSGGNSRRTINGSPMHTTATKSLNSAPSYPASSSSAGSMKHIKPQGSYPKQQMPLGSGPGSYGHYYGSGGAGAAHLPPGGSYYPNAAAMPPGAIYYAQPPMRSSSGAGDFLFGMMAGHMASNVLFGPRHHITHVYHQNPQENSPKVIVINNGEATTSNASEIENQNFWPTDSQTPLAPFNSSITPDEAMQPGKKPFFPKIKSNNFPNTQMIQTAQNFNNDGQGLPPQSSQDLPASETASSESESETPIASGIICMPVVLNETDPNDPTKVQKVDKIFCFPAPPPPPSPPPSSESGETEVAGVNCVTRTFIETDPSDPSRTLEVLKEICTTPNTTVEPPQVAGEIGEAFTSDAEKETTLAKDDKDDDNSDYNDNNEDKRSEVGKVFGATTESGIVSADSS